MITAKEARDKVNAQRAAQQAQRDLERKKVLDDAKASPEFELAKQQVQAAIEEQVANDSYSAILSGLPDVRGLADVVAEYLEEHGFRTNVYSDTQLSVSWTGEKL